MPTAKPYLARALALSPAFSYLAPGDLCMFSPMFYEELVLCGNMGRLKAWENQDFLPEPRFKAGWS